jgi:hypothetical protein
VERVEGRTILKNKTLPDLGPMTPKVLELFERALAEREYLKRWIEELSSKSKSTIRDQICLALYRHQLSFREPPLPGGGSLIGATLWEYWAGHQLECRKYCRLENEIRSYLETPESLYRRALSGKVAMMNLIRQDSVMFLANYQAVDEMFGKLERKPGRGRPATRRLTAVRALQMQIDKNCDLKKVTQERCDCGKAAHNESCEQQMRQSIGTLKRLLRKWGTEPSKP